MSERLPVEPAALIIVTRQAGWVIPAPGFNFEPYPLPNVDLTTREISQRADPEGAGM